MSIKPITPDEVASVRARSLPPEVIAVWNELIAENWNGRSAVVGQGRAVRVLTDRLEVTRDDVYDKGWLNIEPVYAEFGWVVEYDKPGYNESYDATFEFTKQR